ncbi:DUF1850 domain-containing protein [Marinobacter sp. X15-166B]|uniref:DUF1850 domain-containing protein n=1 Tax=Marinobacter sp. X15-166B TaxID=1897620 RepID=UPI00085C588F|nr:DUF1850 domain-containing protein [Marinobacter sp. X15-166B]OEY66398.1 hypothetical protein BG841_07960 [Marinobacter sp. X15-166B]
MQRQGSAARLRLLATGRWLTVFWMTGLPLAAAGPPPAAAHPPHRLQAVTGQGELLMDIAVPPGMRWCMEWNHSVQGFTVKDCYRNRAGVLQLERSHQPDFAAGLGHTVGRGEQISDGQGGYWINGIDEPVAHNRYVLRVGTIAVNHRVVWRDGTQRREVSLSAQAPGERVTIQLIRCAPRP